MAKTWKELEAEGVKRCCAVLRNRKTGKAHRCKRRASKGGFCDTHRPTMEAYERLNLSLIEALKDH